VVTGIKPESTMGDEFTRWGRSVPT
jgi:hypothetical protein